MIDYLQALILGIVQGLTEFLPVSSSGHLAILQNFFGDVDVSFDIFLHFATLLAVFVFFYKDILDLINGFFTFEWEDKRMRFVVYLLLASIPAGLIGFFFRNLIGELFSDLYIVAGGFLISGLFLFIASFTAKNSFVIGCAQALALVPGISRSGSTISTTLLFGIDKKEAIKFSFLLSIPAILGANLLELKNFSGFSFPMVLGFLIAFVFGLLSIYLFYNRVTVRGLR